jgi:hypothetical protein
MLQTFEVFERGLHLLCSDCGTDDRLLSGSSATVFIALGNGLEKRGKLVFIDSMCFLTC